MGSNPSNQPPDPNWLAASILVGEPPALWLERPGNSDVIDAAIMQAAGEAALRLRSNRDRPGHDDRTRAISVLTPPEGSVTTAAINSLGLSPMTQCRVVARDAGVAQIVVIAPRGALDTPEEQAFAPYGNRIGISSRLPATELPRGWDEATRALAFAAIGSAIDPGPPVAWFEDIALWAQILRDQDAHGVPPRDVQILNHLHEELPWVLPTLEAVVTTISGREAAARIFTHHSTLQSRLALIEARLPWSVTTPQGRFRTASALAVRSYLMHPPCADPPIPASPLVIHTRRVARGIASPLAR